MLFIIFSILCCISAVIDFIFFIKAPSYWSFLSVFFAIIAAVAFTKISDMQDKIEKLEQNNELSSQRTLGNEKRIENLEKSLTEINENRENNS